MAYYYLKELVGLRKTFECFREDYLYNFSLTLNKPLIGPRTLQLNLTSRCNLRCRMCGAWKEPMTESKADRIKKLIDQTYSLGNLKEVILTGGEALLYDELFTLIEHVKKSCKGTVSILNTNGFLLDEPTCLRLMDAGLDILSISVDSPVKEVHDSLRRAGSLERVIKAADFIYRMKQERNVTSPRLVTCSVLMNQTLDTMPGMLEFCARHHFENLLIQAYVSNGDFFHEDRKDEFWVPRERLPELKKVLDRINADKDKYPGLHVDVPDEKIVRYFSEPVYVDKCYVGFKQVLLVDTTFTFICLGGSADRRRHLGFVGVDDLRDCWESDWAVRFREAIKACKKTCVQFCSIRPQSDSAERIHDQVAAQENLFFMFRELEFLQRYDREYPGLGLGKIIEDCKGIITCRSELLFDYHQNPDKQCAEEANVCFRNDLLTLNTLLKETRMPWAEPLLERCGKVMAELGVKA